ncbi:cholesterol 24-hydroxylase-like [Corticium candelabrum]|uniref:cholesterol 24-hydroxylase-like n=1 Tax=Corticium candelabrum TaxID=121492 RepID=UPI002E2555BB|nr:cholesterol 24-hydroxylase-like [Corticium candelabrum]
MMLFVYLCCAALGFSCLIALSFTALAVLLYRKRYHFRMIPGPPIKDFFRGHVSELRERYKQGKAFHTWHLELCQQYGNIFILWTMHHERIYVCHPDNVRKVLVNSIHSKSPDIYRKSYAIYGKRFLGSGLASNVNHADWQRRHIAIAPAFQTRQLRHRMCDFNDITRRFISRLEGSKCKVLSMKQLFPLLTVELIAKVALGLDSQTIQDSISNSSIPRALAAACRGYLTERLNPLLWLKPWKRGTLHGIHNAVEQIRQISKDCICKRQNELMAGSETPNDGLDHIIKMAQVHPDLTLEDLIDEVVTIFVAGFDTAATTLCLAIRELSQVPDVEKQLLEEITQVLGSRRNVEFEDLTKLQYTTAIIKEVLRLYPAAYATIRQLQNTQSMCGVEVPSGSNVVVSFYVMHRLPEYWKEPEKFSPNRFLNQNNGSIHSFTYLPYSAGPRMCLGKQLVTIEMKVALALLYQTFRFEVMEDPDTWGLTQDMILRPNTEIKCKLHLRSEDIERHKKT